jgi:hypothetical protein
MYCGKLASNVVKALEISGLWLIESEKRTATSSSFLRSPFPVRSSSLNSNPLEFPKPGTGGGVKNSILASFIKAVFSF